MKSFYPIGLLFLLLVAQSGSSPKRLNPCEIYGVAYIEENPSRAHFRVYEESSEAFADIIVFEEQNRLYADKVGIWSFTDKRDFADFYVYFEESKGRSDFSVYFTDFESFAGCNR